MAESETVKDILQEQLDYYDARAPEYDDWFYRRGRYDWGNEANLQWANEVNEIRRHLLARDTVEETLELAAGTGIWTTELLRFSRRVTALDGSSEMIRIHRDKLQCDRVVNQQIDLFHWQPTRRFDFVAAFFWLSHVPTDRLIDFLGRVKRALRPSGVFFFGDSRLARSSRAKDHEAPEVDISTSQRRLDDGREYRIVKVFHEPVELTRMFTAAGLRVDLRETAEYFLYGTAVHC